MTGIGAASLRLATGILLLLFVASEWAADSEAARPTHEQAMADCRAHFGKKVINAVINKNDSVTCQWQVRREMTHAEAWEACRKQFGATQAFVQKKKDGWWCRYKARY
jgi:hypothetical protein